MLSIGNRNTKYIVRKMFATSLNMLGLLDDATSPFIVMYHRVLRGNIQERRSVQPGMYVTSQTLEMQVEVFKKRYHILHLGDLLKTFFGGGDVTKCCALTFDDGWIDHYHSVYPLIEKYEIPATFFIPTAFIGTKERFWSDEIAQYLIQTEEKEYEYLFKKTGLAVPDRRVLNEKLGHYLTEIIRRMKALGTKEKQIIIDEIRGLRGEAGFEEHMLNWPQIMEMNATGLCRFYPHSHSHELMDSMSEEDIYNEVALSKKCIEENIKEYPISIFSYPSGRTNERVKEILRHLNIEHAVTTSRGSIDKSVDRYEVKRMGLHDDISNTETLLRYVLLH